MPYKAEGRVDRNAVKAAYWQFDPEEEDPEIEMMECALSFHRGDADRVLIAVRGKVRGRFEGGDSAWIELEDEEAIKLIKRLAETLGKEVT